MTEADLVVIGGGAGGLSAARAARRAGASTLLVQEGPLGGDCTFTGCVPSKALIEAAGRGDSFERAIGLVREAVRSIAATEDDDVLRSEGVDVVHGRAAFRSAGVLDVDGRTVRSPRFVIATGARPLLPTIDGLAEVHVLTSDSVWDLEAAPTSLAVIGGGSIGCELGQAFARLGARVTLVEGAPRILLAEDPQAAEVVAAALRADGVDLRTGTTVERVRPSPGSDTEIVLSDGTSLSAQHLLVAVGREAMTDGLGLEEIGVELEDGSIAVDATLASTAEGVWAVGDVTGLAPFTHAADEMGRIAAGNALGRWSRRRFRADRIPRVTFTDPEVAQVGSTEGESVDAGGRVGYVPMSEVDRAVAAHDATGFVKLIAGPRPVLRNAGGGRLLGATIVCPRAGELVHEAALAMRTGMFTGRLAQTVHAYPTWSTAIRQAAAQFFMESGGRRARPAVRPRDL